MRSEEEIRALLIHLNEEHEHGGYCCILKAHYDDITKEDILRWVLGEE